MTSVIPNRKSDSTHYILHKLGEALYIRDKRRKQANRAVAAVAYLKDQGIFQ